MKQLQLKMAQRRALGERKHSSAKDTQLNFTWLAWLGDKCKCKANPGTHLACLMDQNPAWWGRLRGRGTRRAPCRVSAAGKPSDTRSPGFGRGSQSLSNSWTAVTQGKKKKGTKSYLLKVWAFFFPSFFSHLSKRPISVTSLFLIKTYLHFRNKFTGQESKKIAQVYGRLWFLHLMRCKIQKK